MEGKKAKCTGCWLARSHTFSLHQGLRQFLQGLSPKNAAVSISNSMGSPTLLCTDGLSWRQTGRNIPIALTAPRGHMLLTASRVAPWSPKANSLCQGRDCPALPRKHTGACCLSCPSTEGLAAAGSQPHRQEEKQPPGPLSSSLIRWQSGWEPWGV